MAFPDPGDYTSHLHQKLIEAWEPVDASLQSRKNALITVSTFLNTKNVVDNPTKGKLDPRWKGPWVVE